MNPIENAQAAGECGRCGSMPQRRDQTCPACSPGLMPYTVILPWAWDCDMGASEGTYATTVEASSPEHAIQLVAEEMAESGQMDFDSDVDKQRYIDSRGSRFTEVVALADSVLPDLHYLFSKDRKSSPMLEKLRSDIRALLDRDNNPQVTRERGG